MLNLFFLIFSLSRLSHLEVAESIRSNIFSKIKNKIGGSIMLAEKI